MKRYNVTRIILLITSLFIGVGALFGSIMMFVDPSGKMTTMNNILPYLKVLPFGDILFNDLVFSGIMLLLVNGITNFISSLLIIIKKRSGVILGMIFGLTLMAWIIIQFVIMPFNFLSTLYFIFGVFQSIVGYICLVSYNQAFFRFEITDYPLIDDNSSTLVVYFSRTNQSKKIAYEIANERGASIREIKTIEKISGTLGFWWCGRFAMHRWCMPLQEDDTDYSKCERIIIVAPIWAFRICAPMRTFLLEHQNDIKNIEYVLVHFCSFKYKKAFKETEKLCHAKVYKRISVSTRLGHEFSKKEVII